MNIVLYKGNFIYGVVDYFVDELCKVFRNKGHNVSVVDLKSMQVSKSFDDSTDLILSYNGIGIMKDTMIYEEKDIVFGALLVDHPFYHKIRIQNMNCKSSFISVLDEGTLDTAERYINRELPFTHLMHAGSLAKTNALDKVYDVVVMGTLSSGIADFEAKVKDLQVELLMKMTKELCRRASSDTCKTLDEHLKELIDFLDIEGKLPEKSFNTVMAYIYTAVDTYLRTQARYNIVLNLLKSGIDVHYFGQCSVDEFNSYSNFINHGNVNYEEALEVMAKSKILVHNIAYFKNGSHERVFSSMLNKSLVVCNTNNYSYGIYKDGESIVYFNNYEELVSKVKYYLENDEERERIVNNAFDITSKYNTWENRADEIIEVYNAVKQMA